MPSGTAPFDPPDSAAPGPLLLPALARSHRLAANARMCDDIVTYCQSCPVRRSFQCCSCPHSKACASSRPPPASRASRAAPRSSASPRPPWRGRSGSCQPPGPEGLCGAGRDVAQVGGVVAGAGRDDPKTLSLHVAAAVSTELFPVHARNCADDPRGVHPADPRWLPVSTIRSGRGYPHWGLACPGKSLRGSIQFPWRQRGEYGIGFEIERQTNDGLRGGDFDRSGKAGETKQLRHAVRIMTSG